MTTARILEAQQEPISEQNLIDFFRHMTQLSYSNSAASLLCDSLKIFLTFQTLSDPKKSIAISQLTQLQTSAMPDAKWQKIFTFLKDDIAKNGVGLCLIVPKEERESFISVINNMKNEMRTVIKKDSLAEIKMSAGIASVNERMLLSTFEDLDSGIELYKEKNYFDALDCFQAALESHLQHVSIKNEWLRIIQRWIAAAFENAVNIIFSQKIDYFFSEINKELKDKDPDAFDFSIFCSSADPVTPDKFVEQARFLCDFLISVLQNTPENLRLHNIKDESIIKLSKLLFDRAAEVPVENAKELLMTSAGMLAISLDVEIDVNKASATSKGNIVTKQRILFITLLKLAERTGDVSYLTRAFLQLQGMPTEYRKGASYLAISCSLPFDLPQYLRGTLFESIDFLKKNLAEEKEDHTETRWLLAFCQLELSKVYGQGAAFIACKREESEFKFLQQALENLEAIPEIYKNAKHILTIKIEIITTMMKLGAKLAIADKRLVSLPLDKILPTICQIAKLIPRDHLDDVCRASLTECLLDYTSFLVTTKDYEKAIQECFYFIEREEEKERFYQRLTGIFFRLSQKSKEQFHLEDAKRCKEQSRLHLEDAIKYLKSSIQYSKEISDQDLRNYKLVYYLLELAELLHSCPDAERQKELEQCFEQSQKFSQELISDPFKKDAKEKYDRIWSACHPTFAKKSL